MGEIDERSCGFVAILPDDVGQHLDFGIRKDIQIRLAPRAEHGIAIPAQHTSVHFNPIENLAA
jgi:hypothetical protein